jgi:hypothetical protein
MPYGEGRSGNALFYGVRRYTDTRNILVHSRWKYAVSRCDFVGTRSLGKA